jgi:hypothetical protein
VDEHSLAAVRAKLGHPDQLYGTRLVRIADGPGDGIRAVEIWNAVGLRLDVLVDRGFDIHRFEHRGRALNWVGPPGLRSRFAYEPDEWGWLRSFHGGLLVTCGLEHTRLPIHRPTPEYYFPLPKTDRFGLHGRVANEGGELLARVVDEDGAEPAIRLRGRVTQATLYGENLWLERELEVPLWRSELRIKDTVVNRGFSPTHHELLYHVNLGYPLVDAGTRVSFETSEHEQLAFEVTEPQPGFIEQMTTRQLAAGPDGFARVEVVNAAAQLGLEFCYRVDTLPYFSLLHMFGEGRYFVGLEPASVGQERDLELDYLEPGASARYEAVVRVLEQPPA